MANAQEVAYSEIERLIKKFKALSAAERKQFNESATRLGYILPLFQALGWDIQDKSIVSPEEKVSRGWVDFAFRWKGIPRFFLETKKMSEDLNDPRWVQQAIDYSWHKGVSWALLSDFEGMRVFNAEWQEADPFRAEFLRFDVDSYLSDFQRLWWFSTAEIEAGTLDREAEKVGKHVHREPVSKHLFDDLKTWRYELFRHLRAYNKLISPQQIDAAVLRILNRLIFIRTAEDRMVEQPRLRPMVRELKDSRRIGDLPEKLAGLFREMDSVYNSELFAAHFSEALECESKPFEDIIEGLYEKNFVRYNFNAIDADVLGTAYEQYLGQVVADPNAAEAVEKKAKRKSQGIYYTPSFVVKYIVQQTLGKHLEESGYNPSRPVRVLDMACGSGSFLIEAFDVLDRHIARLRNQTQVAAGKAAGINSEGFDDYARRIEILTQCIYGVDLDEQAVAVARLNLLLRALHSREKLPMLENIRLGNSLISGTPEELKTNYGKEWQTKKPFNWEKEFGRVFKDELRPEQSGFDIIIGNPPYFNIDTFGKQSPDMEWIKTHYPEVWMDKSDILFYFIARAISLVYGRIGFIVSRAFLEADKAQHLRQYILDHCAIETVIDFRDFRVFQDANISTAIIILRHEPNAEQRNTTMVQAAQIHITQSGGEDILRAIENCQSGATEFADEQFSFFNYPQSRLSSEAWNFAPLSIDTVYERIDGNNIKIGDTCFVGEGMQTGANDVFEVDERIIHKERLEKKMMRKHAANSDISRYLIQHSGTWLIWTENADNFKDCPEHISAHLKANSIKLKKRAAYVRGNCEWFKFTWPLHREWYDRPKIITPYRAPNNRFAIDEAAEYIGLTDTTIIFKRDNDKHDLRYYLALLNSHLLTFRFQGIGKRTGSGMYEYFENSISQLPIRRINFDDPTERQQHDSIVGLVEEMLHLQMDFAEAEREKEDRRHALKRRIDELDRQIDILVYRLYGLTEDEIKVVEGTTS
jgi:type I restriction-modification system DNA methylase subunit